MDVQKIGVVSEGPYEVGLKNVVKWRNKYMGFNSEVVYFPHSLNESVVLQFDKCPVSP